MTLNLKLEGRLKVLDGGVARVDEDISYSLNNIYGLQNGAYYSISANGGTQEITVDSSSEVLYITSSVALRVASDTDITNESATFTADAGTDMLTIASQKQWPTGTAVTVSSDDTLPAGLSASTTYYWISRGLLQGQLATSNSNAEAGTQIDVTDAGTGTHTVLESNSSYYNDIDQAMLFTKLIVVGSNVRRIYLKNPSTSAANVRVFVYRD